MTTLHWSWRAAIFCSYKVVLLTSLGISISGIVRVASSNVMFTRFTSSRKKSFTDP